MLSRRKNSARLALGALAVALLGLGADAPDTKLVNAEGVTFRVPASWKTTKPTMRFRKAEVQVAPAEGDKEPAELVVTAFAGDGGGVEANVERWKGMFQAEDGSDEPKVEERQAKNASVTVVEVSGRYIAAERPGSPKKLNKPGYRLFGVMVPSSNGMYFFKMVGPDKTMTAARPALDELVKSINVIEP